MEVNYDDALKTLLGRVYAELEESKKRGEEDEYQVTLSESEFELIERLKTENKINVPDGYIATGSLTNPKLMTAHGYSSLLSSYFTEKNTWPVDVAFKNLKYEVQVPAVDPGVTTVFDALKTPFTKSKSINKVILDNLSGSFKAGKTTLVLGPPGSGISTFFKALCDVLVVPKNGKLTGNIKYSGFNQSDILVRKFSTYVDQLDIHTATLSVEETLDFSFQCFGGNLKYLGIDLNKVSLVDKESHRLLAFSDVQNDLKEYILRRFGLKNCENTFVGGELIRGISGGELRRLTTTEMFIGNKKLVCFDQLSTGLDSATAFDIVRDLKHWSKNLNSTFIFSLLQATPEVYNLFDEVLLFAEGKILYHGEREKVLPFFKSIGYECPTGKDIADFLQEVTTEQRKRFLIQSMKPLDNKDIAIKWNESTFSQDKKQEIEQVFNQPKVNNIVSNELLIGRSKYCLDFFTDFKLVFKRQTKLFYRNKPYLIARVVQCLIISLLLGTVFYDLSPELNDLSLVQQRLALLFYVCLQSIFSGFALLPHIFETRSVFYKQRRNYLHRVSSYVLSSFVVALPMQLLEAFLLTTIMFWLSNLVPSDSSDVVNIYFFVVLIVWLLTLGLAGYIRFIACVAPNPEIGFVLTGISVASFVLFSGFIILPDNIPPWFIWIYWGTPVSWALRSIAKTVFESEGFSEEESRIALAAFSIEDDSNYVTYGILFLIAFIIFSQFLVIVAMSNINFDSSGKRRTVNRIETDESTKSKSPSIKNDDRVGSSVVRAVLNVQQVIPATLVFKDLTYDIPIHKKETKRLLHGISGYAQPGTITALMGASGAGKTTLMDVIAGRKTAGTIGGEILINGIPKPKGFASRMGYVEQTDVHCPHQTVREAIFFSARLRQSAKVSTKDINEFVNVVLKTLELDNISHFEVGITGLGGLSKEEAKRLTIGVELAANPSILFCDEPTSGLDSRAAEVIMESIKRVSLSGRTVVCTIHQPNREIFELFDKILLLQKGGRTVYFGNLGEHSNQLVSYFENIKNTPKLPHKNYNPATYMLEVIGAGTSTSKVIEEVDYPEEYSKSELRTKSLEQLNKLSIKTENTELLKKSLADHDVRASLLTQFRLLLTRAFKSFWRDPGYNIVRFVNMLVMAFIWGFTYWKNGVPDEDFTSTRVIGVIGVLFNSVMFIGVVNLNLSIQPMFLEKAAYLRERASLMYTPSMYLLSWTIVELPYLILNTLAFCFVFYSLIGFKADILLFCTYWLLFALFVLVMTFLGHTGVALFPNPQVVTILMALFISIFGLFAGFLLAIEDVSNFWQFMTYVAPTRYALNAIAAVFFNCDCSTQEVLAGNCTSTDLGCNLVIIDGEGNQGTAWDLLQNIYGFKDRVSADIIALVIFLIVCRVLALIGYMRVKAKR